jgi:hypothetical protein
MLTTDEEEQRRRGERGQERQDADGPGVTGLEGAIPEVEGGAERAQADDCNQGPVLGRDWTGRLEEE